MVLMSVENEENSSIVVGTSKGDPEMSALNRAKFEEDDEDDEELGIKESKVLVVEAVPIDIFCMTISQAYSIYPKDKVVEAIEKEIKNMIDMGVFGPVEKGSDIPKKMVIPSMFFLKDKGNSDNIELKGRFVGGGHRQDETIYERNSSPTTSPQTIFITLADAAEKKKSILIGDVPCAYLHAPRGDLPKVYVRLNKEMTAALIKLCPEFASMVQEDGTIIVEILKGLYGLIESGHTWYNHLTAFLISIGFTVCQFDKCVFKKGKINLVIYVDDLLLTGPEDGRK